MLKRANAPAYFGALSFEHADGRAAFLKAMLDNKESYLKATADHARPVVDPSVKDPFKLPNRDAYSKGAWVLRMLRREPGGEKFFAGEQSVAFGLGARPDAVAPDPDERLLKVLRLKEERTQ